jgi:predicted MFS family arabinose efflux permease
MIRRKGGVGLLVVAYILLITAALTLTLAASLPVYLFAAALFTPIVMVIEPIQFGVLGRVDSTGRLAALGPAAISVGSAIGPLVASASVGLFGLVSIGVLASSFIIVSILLLYPLAHQAYRVKN